MSTAKACDENQDELARLRALTGVERALWELAMNILDVARALESPCCWARRPGLWSIISTNIGRLPDTPHRTLS